MHPYTKVVIYAPVYKYLHKVNRLVGHFMSIIIILNNVNAPKAVNISLNNQCHSIIENDIATRLQAKYQISIIITNVIIFTILPSFYF